MKADVSGMPSPVEAVRQEVRSPEEISLRELRRALWRGRILVLVLTLGLAGGAFVTALLLPKHYVSRVLVIPATKDSRESGIGAALGQFAGLASLAGLTTQAGGFKAEALATLQSDVLTVKYIKEQNLLPILFASKWDPAQKTWKSNVKGKAIPTLWRGNKYFSDTVRDVKDDKKTGLVSVEVTWTDPDLAAKWANEIVDLTNDYMRSKAIHESEANMAYLTEQAQKTNIVEMRQTIYTLMQGELKTAMLAEGNREFALKIIDPAVPAERPDSPKRGVWTVCGFFAGLLLSVLIVIGREGWAKSA